MKTTLALISIITITSVTTVANADEDQETLFGEAISHGGFGGPSFKLTPINGETNYMMGGKGAWLINRQFYVGGGGYGALKRIDANGSRLDFGYGGIMLGYIGAPTRMIHFAFDLLVGGGAVTENTNQMQSTNLQSDEVVVVEPTAYLTVNLTKFAEFNIGAGYRYVDGISNFGLKNSDMSDWLVTTNIMFGKF